MGKLFQELLEARISNRKLQESEAAKSGVFNIEVEKLNGQIPHQYWTEGVMYKGLNVYDAVYEKSDIEQQILDKLEHNYSGEYEFTFTQECFLAYNPSSDLFMMGFDGSWKSLNSGDSVYSGYSYSDDDEEDEDAGDDDEEEGNCAPYGIFKLSKDGTVELEKVDLQSTDDMWYPNAMKWAIRKGFVTLIRLD